MSDDYRAKPRSNLDVRQLANRARQYFGVSKKHRVDVLACLNRATIWTVTGEKRLIFQIRPDCEMGKNDASTIFGPGVVTVVVKQSVYDAGFMGDGRARNTLAHELGHAVMHDGPEMFRRAEGNVRPGWIRAFESAEHQAKVFAAAFLINDVIASTFSSAEDISIEFGVSIECATIYLKEQVELRDKKRMSEQLLQLAAEIRAASAPIPKKTRFLKEPCSVCRNPTVFPVGHKFMCQNCNTIFDQFQDGDCADQ
jgi:Zn-dependent peptidase ImmA (M78 family)